MLYILTYALLATAGVAWLTVTVIKLRHVTKRKQGALDFYASSLVSAFLAELRKISCYDNHGEPNAKYQAMIAGYPWQTAVQRLRASGADGEIFKINCKSPAGRPAFDSEYGEPVMVHLCIGTGQAPTPVKAWMEVRACADVSPTDYDPPLRQIVFSDLGRIPDDLFRFFLDALRELGQRLPDGVGFAGTNRRRRIAAPSGND